MYTGIALYGTNKTTAKNALSLGVSVFESLGLSVEKCAYNQYIKNGDHRGDHDLVDASFTELESLVVTDVIGSFRLYDEKKGYSPWFASFGLSIDDFGNFHHIDIQLPSLNEKEIISLIDVIISTVSFDYGIIYPCDKSSKAFYYSTGDNLVSLYPFENSSLFNKETPGRFNGAETYRTSKLRMVYPFNMLNRNHLAINIGDSAFEEWVTVNKVGNLNKLSEELWCWSISEQLIPQVNKLLGEAGVLISWKKEAKKQNVMKLP